MFVWAPIGLLFVLASIGPSALSRPIDSLPPAKNFLTQRWSASDAGNCAQHKTNQLCGDEDQPAISSSEVIEVPLAPLTAGDLSTEQLITTDVEFGVHPELFYCLITQARSSCSFLCVSIEDLPPFLAFQ